MSKDYQHHDYNPFLVTQEWLKHHIERPDISIIDGSWFLPAAHRDAREEYANTHIIGAVFFDHELVSDQKTNLPHTLPKPEDFARYVSAMGVTQKDTIIIYETNGFFSAPRVWWMMRIMGAKKVFILDGGLKGWKDAGLPVTNQITKVAPASFLTDFQRDKVVFYEEMIKIVSNTNIQIIDARSSQRFFGHEVEPRQGLRLGHMPNAYNVPYALLSENGLLKSKKELKTIFENADIDISKPIVTTCGSGITAAVLILALESLGNDNVRLYDGSWSEWGTKKDSPVAVGHK
ncbi:3-mercaptopyruvate sulfurtransferase [Bartonella tamiae]|uniref:Sulfurtransferase n=1 Tax=Bartonella tamiae Th239 TaxID=1094558 RepID=J1JWP8_9HYPH|nr:3-mercaptopyruvate sulfurtransferase [Bartonella tamiae]EJF89010.1 hypothetical protein ME5_01561 [Bartonella tamiae Th239]EJF94740.1 hypothetical protein MEG_00321 [Bartonella tamiae Th307]